MMKLNDFVFLLVAWSMFCAMPACAMPGAMPQPRWRPDGEALECGACGAEFSLLRRRHHCRRCGGVFCDPCSAARERLLRLDTPTRVRVCARCAPRARLENACEEQHYPLLLGGDVFAKRSRLLGRERRVELILSPDRRHLRYRVLSASPAGAAAADVKRILLDNVARVALAPPPRALLVATRCDERAHVFEAGSEQQAARWLRALLAILEVARDEGASPPALPPRPPPLPPPPPPPASSRRADSDAEAPPAARPEEPIVLPEKIVVIRPEHAHAPSDELVIRPVLTTSERARLLREKYGHHSAAAPRPETEECGASSARTRAPLAGIANLQ